MQQQENPNPFKKLRPSVVGCSSASYMRSPPTVDIVNLPSLNPAEINPDEIAQNWENKSIREIASTVEENFSQAAFINSHGFINSQSNAYTQVELTATSNALFRMQDNMMPLHMVYPDDSYIHLRQSKFNYNYTLLEFGYGANALLEQFEKRFRNELFVRSCYWQLYYLMELDVLANQCMNFIVTGTSGIGKTRFGLFYMAMAAKQGKTFLYHHCDARSYLLGPGFSIECAVNDMVTWLKLNKLQKIDYYFFDTDAVVEPNVSLFNQCKVSIAFASPNPARFKMFMKQHLAVKLVMKMPSEQELMEMRNIIPAFMKIPQGAFESQLMIYGPIPRYVLESWSYGREFFDNSATTKRTDFLLRILMEEFDIISRGDDDEISYMMIHMDSSDFSYNEVSYVFASEFVVSHVMERNRTVLTSALLHWIQKPAKAFAGAVGNLFDSYGHELFVAGKVFVVEPLASPQWFRKYGNVKVHAIAGQQHNLDLTNVVVETLPADWADVVKDRYYVHDHVNMESADCIYIHGTTLYVLQFTVSSHHPIKGEGLSIIITEATQRFPGNIQAVEFIFVSPNQAQCIDRIQALHVPGGSRNYRSLNDIPQNIRDFNIHTTQYIVKIARADFDEVLANVPAGNN